MISGPDDKLARIVLMHRKVGGVSDLCGVLGLAGWSVVVVRDEVEALEAVKSIDFDAAILHVDVADVVAMDFPNVIRRISGTYLPVVIVAEKAGEPLRCQFLESGADDIVTPPTSPAELTARIRALLRIKKLHDQLAGSRTALQEALRRERELLAKLRQDNEHLQHLATTDPLTRVQNLRSFQGLLDHEFKIAKRYNQALALLMLDVDHFKVVNDTHGHPSGNYVLKELAVIFRHAVRESDVVARTGGEEFTILLPKADLTQAAVFARRIREEASAREFAVYGRQIHVTVSIGVAVYPADAEITEPGMLVHFADQALLVAKETGRDRVVAFHDLDAPVRSRLRRQYACPVFRPDTQLTKTIG